MERPEWALAVALAIGLLVGAEREHRRGDDPRPVIAGVRTFTLASLFGAILWQLGSPLLVGVGLGAVALVTGVAYWLSDRTDPGITTELALLVTYALGALAQTQPLLALGTGVTVSFLLAVRAPLHRLLREVVSRRELLDALTFAIAAVVVLPLVPDRAIDPWGALNPFVLWRLAVIVMAITGAGYLALRWVGPRHGLFVAGLASGFVSSAATIGAMGARARQDEGLTSAAVAGAAASTIATFVQLALLVAITSPALAWSFAPSIAAGGVTALGYGAVMAWRASRGERAAIPAGRAFEWRSALTFVAIVAVVTVGAVLLRRWLGDAGVLLGAGISGLADMHAASSAVASLTVDGSLSFPRAHLGILIAISTNTVSKAVFAISAGPRAFWQPVVRGITLVLLAAWAAFALAR
jgi:uncharacterized membrane protein (DUF4010 family)